MYRLYLGDMRTKRKASKRLIFAPDPKQSMWHFVANLNDRDKLQPFFRDRKTQILTVYYAPLSSELRRMVDLWQASKHNLRTLFETDRELAKELHTFRVQLIADHEGAPRLSILTAPQGDGAQTPHSIALALFLDFLLNPVRDLLGGPCKECGRYYVMDSRKHYSFCTNNCGKKYTSRKTNRDRAREEHEDKIARVKIAIKKWQKTAKDEAREDFVHRTEFISKKFLTLNKANWEPDEPKRTTSAKQKRH